MEYETPDGSQFSLREVWKGDDGEEVFVYTTVSAYVDSVPYVGKLDERAPDVDEGDVLASLEPVSLDCIHPKFSTSFTRAPEFDESKHYLKAPSFTYEDCRPGTTFVADCLLNEVTVLESLRTRPHRNIVSYYGCVVKEGLVSHVCLERCRRSLAKHAESGLSVVETDRLLEEIKSALEHLHSLGLAHNDINPDNVCIDEPGNAKIVDFDACLPFGQELTKGLGCDHGSNSEAPVSSMENDLQGFELLKDFLWSKTIGENAQ